MNDEKQYAVRSLAPSIGEFTVSLHFDRKLYRHDITASKVHASMLGRQGIISSGEAQSIIKGLIEIEDEIGSGQFQWLSELEDIHMNIEIDYMKK